MDGGRQSSFTPPLPPTLEDTRLEWLRLLRSSRIGISTFYKLMNEFGDARSALDALPDLAQSYGLKGFQLCSISTAEAELAAAEKCGAKMITVGDATYPTMLYALADPPPILWTIGDLDLLKRPSIGIVGARNASSLGLRMARKLSEEMTGHVIVSGMARGIDAEAHTAALTLGTIAVVGGGVDVVYPSENAALYDEICCRGLVVSEQPMGLAPMAKHFPKRNRIIAGLSRAVVVVEAAHRSGTMITAHDALDMGREVMAVPGSPLDPRSEGPNALIRDGALLVRNAADVLEHLPEWDWTNYYAPQREHTPPQPRPPEREKSNMDHIAGLHAQILERLTASPVPRENVFRDCNISAKEGLRALTDLELDGEIIQDASGKISRLN